MEKLESFKNKGPIFEMKGKKYIKAYHFQDPSTFKTIDLEYK